MRKIIWTITVIGLLVAGNAANASASKKETIGIGTGGVIGAVAGGPIGFMVGAAIGAKLGDTLHKKDTQIDSLSASLDESRNMVGDLEYDVHRLSSRPEVLSLLQAGIAMDLLFRTDEHVLVDTTGGRLAELGSTLSSMPDVQVQLDGFADERGDSAYNQRLSQKRVDFVKEQLVAAGVEPSRINISAHGEAPAQDDSVDSFALERRVSLTMFVDNSPSFASNPE